jgi:hypothetical protein
MRRRRLLLGAGLLLLLATAGLVVFRLVSEATSVSRLNYNKLQVGKTEAQAKAILGEPKQNDQIGASLLLGWISDDAVIWATFDQDRRLTHKSMDRLSSHEDFFNRLFDWLGW